MNKTLYRLKSNKSTIVESDGQYNKVFWADSMHCGYDARWMIHRFSAHNVIPLTEEEEKHFRALVKNFEETKRLEEHLNKKMRK